MRNFGYGSVILKKLHANFKSSINISPYYPIKLIEVYEYDKSREECDMAMDKISGITGASGVAGAYQQESYNQSSASNKVEPVQNITGTSPIKDTETSKRITIKDQEELRDILLGDDDKKAISDEDVGQELNDIKKKLGYTECKFGIDEATNRITIKIVDKESKKVIKEVPPEKTLKMIAKVWEIAGILVDEKL